MKPTDLLFASGRAQDTTFVALVPRAYFEENGRLDTSLQVSHLLPDGWDELSAGVYDPGMDCGEATKVLLDRGFQPSKKFQDFVDASGDKHARSSQGQDRDGRHELHG